MRTTSLDSGDVSQPSRSLGVSCGEQRGRQPGRQSPEEDPVPVAHEPKSNALTAMARVASHRDSRLRVARTWTFKESAMMLWGYVYRGWAKRAWKSWYDWAVRSHLKPIERVARLTKY